MQNLSDCGQRVQTNWIAVRRLRPFGEGLLRVRPAALQSTNLPAGDQSHVKWYTGMTVSSIGACLDVLLT